MTRYFITLLLAITLAACSTNARKEVKVFSSLEEVTLWSNSGRVGIRTDNDAHSGSFNWQHSDHEFELVIHGPFGQGTVKISGNESHTEHGDLVGHENHHQQNIILEYKDVVASGTDAEALLLDHFGWHFPVVEISYWVRGIPYPDQEAQISYEDKTQPNLPTIIEQGDWTINYSRYKSVNGIQLPHKLQAKNPPYRVNLIINSWEIQ